MSGANYVGANTSRLRIVAVTASDTGQYCAVVTATKDGMSTNILSEIVPLVLNPPPLIVTQPVALTTGLLDSAALISMVAAPANGGTLSYRWNRNGIALTDDHIRYNTDSATIKWWTVRRVDSGVYAVTVINALNSTLSYATTDTARLLVHYPPTLMAYPGGSEYLEGWPVSFTMTVAGEPGASLAYQWLKGATPLADTGRFHGTQTLTLNIDNVNSIDAGGYAFTAVSTLNGTHMSSSAGVAQLTVDSAPVITGQPISHAVAAGAPIFIGVSVGYQPNGFAYHWQKEAVDLQDDGRIDYTATPDLVINNATPADAGNYRVRILTVLRGDSLTTVSSYAVITVN